MAAETDLTTLNTTVTVNGAILSNDIGIISGGSGNLDSFVRIGSNNPAEQGYNTGGTPQLDSKSGAFTHALSLSSIPIVVVNGVAYYTFELDINQNNTTPGSLLSLDSIQIWQASSGSLTNYAAGATPDQGTGTFPAADSATLIYNLDSGGDKFVG